ncbi:hypothetical protein FA821_13380 [Salmonella enterica]|nr:hypothetical protein [Salmonella enterica]
MTATNFNMPPEELREKLSYCEDDGKLYWIKPKGLKLAGSLDNHGYYRFTSTINGERRHFKNHRIVYWLHTGEWPEIVDHINRNPKDNRIENLRAATPAESSLNRVYFNRHGYPHINFHKGKWNASVRVNDVTRSVCNFETKEEAAAAADILNYQVNGEFATFGLLSVDEIKAIIKGDRDEAQRIIQQAILVRSLKSYLLTETKE